MKAVAYCRVSTEDQQDRKTIDNQVEFAIKYTELHEIELVKIYKDDGISGTIPFEDREAGGLLIEDAKNNEFDTLLLYKLDRLGRSARITLNTIYVLESYGIKIKSMTEPFETDNPTGKFMITMLAGVADLERSTILERMQYGTEKAARESKWLGGIVPYGYTTNKDGFLEINEEKMSNGFSEADVIRKIFDMLAKEKSSTFKIADYLNQSNIETHYYKARRKIKRDRKHLRTEGIWRPTGIGNMVKNTVYMGIHEYGKRRKGSERQPIKRSVPAIVSEEIYNLAIQQLSENRKKSIRNTKNRTYLLRGLIKCGICGRTYIGISYKGKIVDNEQTYLTYYLCSGKSNVYKYFKEERCTGKAIRADKIEDFIWQLCSEIIKSPARLEDEINIIDSKKEIESCIDYVKEIERLKKEILKSENEKQNMLLLYRKSLLSINDIEMHLKEIEAISVDLKERIKQLEKNKTKQDNFNTKVDDFRKLAFSYKDSIDNADSETKRNIIENLISRIVVNTDSQNETTIKTIKANIKIDVYYSFF